jgi:hypothetical protein
MRVPSQRRHKNYVPRRVDNRFRSARRAKALRVHYTEVLAAAGRELSIELAAAVTKAAELVALVEDMRARALRGTEINADDLVRMQRLADLSVRRLALPSVASKPAPTLGDLLRADHERQVGRTP